MNLLADENVDAPIVAALRAAGHRVRYVLELDPGIDDPRVLALANADQTLLLTSDKDFGELVLMIVTTLQRRDAGRAAPAARHPRRRTGGPAPAPTRGAGAPSDASRRWGVVTIRTSCLSPSGSSVVIGGCGYRWGLRELGV